MLPALGITSTSIVIDGDLADWTGVRADPQNASHDSQISDPDPDYPGQPDRDVYLVNATWDSEFLYLAFRRTSGGTKAITFGAYIDRGGDGLLQDSDVCVMWTVSQSPSGRFADAHAPSPSALIVEYNQARDGVDGPFIHPDGDPMGHDGETPDGWARIQDGQILPQEPMDGWLADNGIEFEGRVAWSDLGVEAGSPIAVHFVNANGESWGNAGTPSTTYKYIGNPPQYLEENRGQIEDNVDDIWWLRVSGVTVAPDNASGGEAGQTITYTHTVTNNSNSSVTYDLSAGSSLGWPGSVTDPSGSPLSSVSLGPGESTTVQVRVMIPVGTADGTRDTTTLTARSRTDSAIVDTATDITTCGRVTVTPDQSATMAPGQTVSYTFTVANNLSGQRTYNLSTLSSMGWPVQISDQAGNPVSSVSLESGVTTDVIVSVSVPAGASIGSQDITRLTATLNGNTSVRAFATGTTTVKAGLEITPDNTGYAGSNTTIFYSHTVANSWPSTRTIALSAVSTRAWPVTFFAADGVTPITQVTLGPNGDSERIYARVTIPAGTAANTVDVTTVTATTGTTTDTATDTTTVRRLMTYLDTGYLTPETVFTLTDTAYARATGLKAGDEVVFVWKNPSGTIMRTSPERTVDTAGMAFDSYPSTDADLAGDWILEMYDDRGRLLETNVVAFKWKAEITTLTATDAPGVGDEVAVTSSVRNDLTRAIDDSVMTYVIWWDTDGSGSFGTGDTWIDSTGAPHVWDGVTAVSSHITTGIDVAGGGTWTEPVPWTVDNHLFPNQGMYQVTARWTELSGRLIDTATTEFFSIPALGWPLTALIAVAGIALLWRRRDLLVPGGAVA
ncbi:MAG: COG1470 family protein [Coriobacteriia bacterium]